jgi:hypothetical protein
LLFELTVLDCFAGTSGGEGDLRTPTRSSTGQAPRLCLLVAGSSDKLADILEGPKTISPNPPLIEDIFGCLFKLLVWPERPIFVTPKAVNNVENQKKDDNRNYDADDAEDKEKNNHGE